MMIKLMRRTKIREREKIKKQVLERENTRRRVMKKKIMMMIQIINLAAQKPCQ